MNRGSYPIEAQETLEWDSDKALVRRVVVCISDPGILIMISFTVQTTIDARRV